MFKEFITLNMISDVKFHVLLEPVLKIAIPLILKKILSHFNQKIRFFLK